MPGASASTCVHPFRFAQGDTVLHAAAMEEAATVAVTAAAVAAVLALTARLHAAASTAAAQRSVSSPTDV